MLSEKYAKLIRSLIHKKYRYEYNLFVAEGRKAVLDILASGFNAVDRIYMIQEMQDETQKTLQSWSDKIHTVSAKEMAKISNLDSSTEILMTGVIPAPYPVEEMGFNKGIHLYLDHIQDPGNLGTILRTAEWFGVQTIGFSEGCADLVHPKVIQASAGSFCKIAYWNGNLNDQAQHLHMPLLGADLDGIDLFKYTMPETAMLIIGSEGQGISAPIKIRMTQTLRIPSYTPNMDSLNAGIAAAVVLAEWQRQLHYK